MPSLPSIKGSVFAGVVEDVAKLLARGAVSPKEAERWLRAEDLALLREPVVITRWYDIRIYTRMNEMLLEVEGGGSHEYLRERGRDTARRLLEAGLYSQLEYLNRVEVHNLAAGQSRHAAFGRDLRLLSTISASILNFSRWTSLPEPGQEGSYRIEVTEAKDFPEVLAWRSDGFVNEMAAQRDRADMWRWERPARDRIVFRMIRDV